MIIKTNRLLRNPPLGTPLDRSNPITRDLELVNTFAEGAGNRLTDYAKGRTVNVVNCRWNVQSGVNGLDTGVALDEMVLPTPIIMPIGSSWTYFWKGQLELVTGGNRGFWRTTVGQHAFCVISATSLPWIRINSTNVLNPLSGTAFPSGIPITCTYVWRNGQAAEWYLNGVLRHSSASALSSVSSNLGAFGWQNSKTTAETINGVWDMHALWFRDLSVNEIQELHEQPYAMFQTPRPLYFDLSPGTTQGSREFESSSSQYADVAAPVATGYPFSFGCWVKPESIGTAGVIFSVATSGSANHFFRVDINASGQNRTRARDTAVSDATTSNAMSPGNWYFVGAVFTSATSRAAFLGTNKGTNGTNRNPSGMTNTSIARSADTGGTATFDGLIAVPTVWNVALSDADMSALAGGTYPTDIQPGSLVAHWPFDSINPGEDIIGTFDLTFFGSSYSPDYPPIMPPSGGSQTITADPPFTSTVVRDPTVTQSSSVQDIVAGPPFTSTTIYNPTITPGTATIVGASPFTSTIVSLPTITLAVNQTIIAAPPFSSTVVRNPTVFEPGTFLFDPGGGEREFKRAAPKILKRKRLRREAPKNPEVRRERKIEVADIVEAVENNDSLELLNEFLRLPPEKRIEILEQALTEVKAAILSVPSDKKLKAQQVASEITNEIRGMLTHAEQELGDEIQEILLVLEEISSQ